MQDVVRFVYDKTSLNEVFKEVELFKKESFEK